MYKKVYAFLLFILAGGMSRMAHAQGSADSQPVDMASLMRSNGKIYVVVTVVLVILLGLILYVARLDRKISRLEKEASASGIKK